MRKRITDITEEVQGLLRVICLIHSVAGAVNIKEKTASSPCYRASKAKLDWVPLKALKSVMQ